MFKFVYSPSIANLKLTVLMKNPVYRFPTYAPSWSGRELFEHPLLLRASEIPITHTSTIYILFEVIPPGAKSFYNSRQSKRNTIKRLLIYEANKTYIKPCRWPCRPIRWSDVRSQNTIWIRHLRSRAISVMSLFGEIIGDNIAVRFMCFWKVMGLLDNEMFRICVFRHCAI